MMRARLCGASATNVAFGHNLRADVLPEARWGAGRPNTLYLRTGTGTAVAVVLGDWPGDRLLVSGGCVGEMGQTLVPDSATGEAIRLEAVASAAAIAGRDDGRRGADVSGDLQGSVRAVVERARTGDPAAPVILAEGGVLGPVPIAVAPVPDVTGASRGSRSHTLGTAALGMNGRARL